MPRASTKTHGQVPPRRRAFDFGWFQVRWLAGYGWIVSRPPGIIVVPIAPDDRVWMMRIARAAVGRTCWELPGGGLEPAERVVRAALRELEEECGLVAEGRTKLLRTVLEPVPGMGTFPHRVVVACGVVPRAGAAKGQASEGIGLVRRFRREQVRTMIQSGAISVQPTLTALLISGWLDGIPLW